METVIDYVIMEVIVILPSIFFGVLRQKAVRTGGRIEWTGGSRETPCGSLAMKPVEIFLVFAPLVKLISVRKYSVHMWNQS